VRDDGSAMKIGTDGVLLGAWAPIRNAKTVLDVGTGCGLVALMIAQRSESIKSQISAIDIDQGASEQAIVNFRESPWPDRLPRHVNEVHVSLDQFAVQIAEAETQSSRSQSGTRLFELVVSNPPFFDSATSSSGSARQQARTVETLGRSSLFANAKSILIPTGRLCLVLPYGQATTTLGLADSMGFKLWSRTDVRPNLTSKFKRVLLEFGLGSDHKEAAHEELVIEESRHQYTEDYRKLTRAFHLRYEAEGS
jgi:tRNA1Val (adenine37-N6)-methyltransferase